MFRKDKNTYGIKFTPKIKKLSKIKYCFHLMHIRIFTSTKMERQSIFINIWGPIFVWQYNVVFDFVSFFF